uniref:Uncharacterized protein n=1 Tax=Avena sativa TaxID=4498 RepID=A0ACD5W4A4_AVESA
MGSGFHAAARTTQRGLQQLLDPAGREETIGHLRRLKILHLTGVHITEEALEHFLSKSVALEQLEIFQCRNIICLTIPCALQQLKILKVEWCLVLQAVEINAPKLSTFYYSGTALLGISVRDSSQLKDVQLLYPSCILYYARTRLPSIARNVKSLTLISCGENVNTPMLPSKLSRLKKLEIKLIGSKPAFSPQYDALSLVSFLEASPALDSFILHISRDVMSHDSVADDYVYLRRKLEFRHEHLRRVLITGFRASKSLVELVIYILESVPSLEGLTLDTTNCFVGAMTGSVAEAQVAVEVAGRCIAGRVPAGVEFKKVAIYIGNQQCKCQWKWYHTHFQYLVFISTIFYTTNNTSRFWNPSCPAPKGHETTVDIFSMA